MGLERWCRGGNCPILLIFILISASLIYGDGNVGCLFDGNVCTPFEEDCFDDGAFGRCISSRDFTENDVYQYDLNPEELEILRKQLEKLMIGNYDWSHPYTQCVIQSTLYNLRYQLANSQHFCNNLEELAIKSFPQFIDDNNGMDEVNPLAMVNFVPSRGHGYGDFANEIYFPPAPLSSSSIDKRYVQLNAKAFSTPYLTMERRVERNPALQFNENKNVNVDYDDVDDDDDVNDDDDDTWLLESDKESRPFNSYDHNKIEDFAKWLEEQKPKLKSDEEMTIFRSRRNRPQQEVPRSFGAELDDYLESLKDASAPEEDEGIEMSMTKTNIFPRRIDRGLAEADVPRVNDMEYYRNDYDKWNKFTHNDDGDDKKEENDDIDTDVNFFSGSSDIDENLPILHDDDGFHIDDSFVQPLDIEDIYGKNRNSDDFNDLPAFLWRQDFSGFKRPERLDVKKPGPFFSTNNYAFRLQTALPENVDNEVEVPRHLVKKELIAGSDITQLSMGMDTSATHNNVDMDFVYIQFNEEFHTWSDGEAVVEKVSELLGMKPGDFDDTRVGRAEVTFRVNENYQNMNANDIVLKLDSIRGKLRETMNLNIIGAGIGDKVKLPPMLEVENPKYSVKSTVFGLMVAAGVGTAAAAALLTLLIARRHAKSRAKLAGLTTPDPEASKDYQELCRARMHAKQLAEKPESPRITSLSRESESNRSSTSSWNGDEAASLSNMDISTGHMVLSYMEDHLKNKDKLDQEWAAICGYEVEPSSIEVATSKSNLERNRSDAVLPYDHSRIVLNDLSNINGSDYINASTITDHDPRNPAYIATQGPLPQTSADFWQLVWEQGSVVIVMLTRLTEEGRAMCHRYWPEEGSEHYHIYEVHLVSEHIWCDDYLVRSFYLKNLRTGETRTVTQFHFLSWPENGVPQSTKALLEFRRKVNKSYRGRSCPIVVHCSDGAGRTGTYCLIDMVLNRMAKGAKEIDIVAALEHLRDQRPGMVAVKQQFEFVLVAVAEEVHAILKVLPVQAIDKVQAPQMISASNVADPKIVLSDN